MGKIFKRTLSTFMATLVLMTYFPYTVFATSDSKTTSGTYEDVLVYEIRDNNVWITSCKSTVIEVIIPETIENCPVIGIDNEAFYCCDKLSNITIPKSITSVGYNAFYGCEKLVTAGPIGSGSNIEFGWDVAIPDFAFYGCQNLVTIEIPDTISSIGYSAFGECVLLNEISLPNCIVNIGAYAFQNTGYYIDESNWTDDVLYIDGYLISAQNTIKGEYVIKGETVCVADSAFRDCTELTGIVIPSTIKELGSMVFYGCTGLKNAVIPNSVQSIGFSTFANCSAITALSIPNSVESIDKTSFDGCTSLIELIIGSGLETIPEEAFYQSTSLEKVVINEGVTRIGMRAFAGCTNLKNIHIANSVINISKYVFANTAFYNDTSNWENGVLYVGKHLVATKDTIEGLYSIKEGTLSIADGAFWGCKKLTGIVIPNSIKGIAAETFYYDYSYRLIENIHYLGTPEEWQLVHTSNEQLKDYVTKNWFSYNIENGEVKITGINYTFGDVIIPESINDYPVTTIEQSAFKDNGIITSITIPENVQRIGIGAFVGCEKLASVKIANNMISIGQNAFIDTAFYNEPSNWENGFLYVGSHLVDAKEDGSIGADLVIKDGTTTVADYIFCNEYIESVVIPNTIMHIGSSAFAGFSGVVYYNGYYDEWSGIDFEDNNDSLISASIHHKLKGENAEYLEYVVESDGVSITGYSGPNYSSINVEIPDTIQGLPVLCIKERAFYDSRISSVKIPNTVTNIENVAFSSCLYLTSIEIPDSVNDLGASAFSNCKSLKTVVLSKQLKSIGDYTFRDCPKLTSIEIPDSVTSVGMMAFYGCSIETLKLSDNIENIGDYAFVGCNITSLRIPSKLTTTGVCIFSSCTKLREVVIPWGVTSIGAAAFSDCLSLTTLILPDSIKKINNNAFNGTALTDVWYMGSENRKAQISIGTYNDSFKNATWHYNICETHTYTANCDATCNECEFIRNTINHSYNDWFVEDNRHSSTCIVCGYVFSDVHEFKYDENNDVTHLIKCTVCSYSYTEEHIWNDGEIVIEPTHLVKGTTRYVCLNCGTSKDEQNIDKLTTHKYVQWVKVNESVHTSICECGWSEDECHNWDNGVISLEASCTTAGIETFTCTLCSEIRTEPILAKGHIEATDIAVNPTCTATGLTEGKHCSVCNVSTVVQEIIPALGHNWDDGVINPVSTCKTHGTKTYTCKNDVSHKYTEQVALDGNNHEGGIYLKDTVDAACTTNGYTGDTYCSTCNVKLTEGEMVPSLGHTDIDVNKFCDICYEYLSEVKETGFCGEDVIYKLYKDGTLIISGTGLMKNYNLVSRSPFEYNDDINTIIIENGVKNIGDSAFEDCDGLKSIVIGNTVESIGESSFYGCDNIENIVIPNSVATIGNEAFAWCSSLANVSLSDNVTMLGDEAFIKCDSLLFIKVPKSLVNIGEECFDSRTVVYCMKNSTIGSYVKTNNYKYVFVDGNDEESVFEGTEKGLTWKVDKRTGLLELSGRGNMPDFSSNPPWYDYGYAITSVNISYTLTSVGSYVFKDLYRLTKIDLPYGITKINNNAFDLCVNLVEIEIPNSVTTISQHAFAYCKKLKSISIPYSVSSFGYEPFLRCDSLESISFELNSKNISNLSYMPDISDTDIKEVVLPASISKAFSGAFPLEVETVIVCNPNFSFNSNCGLTSKSTIISFKGSTAETFAAEIGANFVDIETVHNHEYKDAEYTKSTCSIEGRKIKRCVCGKEQETIIDKILHTPAISVIENIVEPMCEVKGGYDEVVYCSVCNTELFRTEKEISALTHNWNNGVIAPVSTCKTHGTKTYTCQNDESHQYTEQVALDSNNHEGSTYLKNQLDATCVEVGYTGDTYCSGCNVKLAEGHIINALGHSLEGWFDNNNGTHIKSCSICNYTEIENCSYGIWTTKKNATCTSVGSKQRTCSVCKNVETTIIAKLAHTYKSTTTKATLSKNGSVIDACSVCSTKKSSTTVYYPKTIKLSKTAYTYNGKVQTPTVIVKDSKGNTLKKDTDYTVKYESGRKAAGKYTVTITFKGKYTGTKKFTYTIAPKAASKVTASQTTTTITLKWNKVTGADGYRVYKYDTKKKKYVKLKDVTGTSLKISKLTAGTKYKYKVRAYTKDDNTIWGAYSAIFETATKAKTPTLKVSSSKKGIAALSWTNVSGESGYQVYYSTKKDSGYKKLASYKTNVVKGLKSKLTSGKTYYFKVRAYTKTDSGTVYSAWSSVKSVKVK